MSERFRVSVTDGCRRLRSLAGAAVLTVWACTPLNGPRDAATDGPSNQDTSTDITAEMTSDASVDVPRDAPTDAPDDASSGTGCGRFSRGPTMVAAAMLARPICVDSTEVTQSQYQQFLAATNGNATGQGPECTWNLNYAPVPSCNFDPTGHASFPVNGVDWCDATAFCKWAGKRLCGGPTGGLIETSSLPELALSEVSEWSAVCSHGGQRGYPYGTVFQGEACNGDEHSGDPAVIVPVGTTVGCEGGYPGVFDMVGNIHEWENACEPLTGTPGRTDNCWFRGGSYHDVGNSCSTGFALSRDYVDHFCDIGFRCCADLDP